ncbi:TonB-dependent receptor plug domain-containing protein [Lacinutrix iliipiscaria]|uniref:TonB-dependent receptor plug domain-containing protein n=1 Tax=Lacinutrix iliipiscaria TaxID=1230532 RepID=A0ABW5WM14_9FLAO
MKTIIQIFLICAVFQLQAQSDKNNDNTILTQNVDEEDELVVTALGLKRDKDAISSAYTVVDSEALVKANNPNIIESLSGKVSGLQIVRSSSGLKVYLRGSRSLLSDNAALIVIDGVISNGSFLEALNPNSIKSVNVIKGANGAALYGSDASNGVLVITTKGGIKKKKIEPKALNKLKVYSGSLKVKNIKSNASYMRAYSSATSAQEAYDIFLNQRVMHQDDPAYYADVFSYFFKWNAKNQTKAILNYILQVEPDNVELLKALAYKLEEAKEYDLASSVYLNVLKLRPEDSQSFRDLALMYAETNKPQRAFDLLNSLLFDNLDETLSSPATNEVISMQQIVRKEVNNILQKNSGINKKAMNNSHSENAKYDLRIVLDWNRENADLDLQVIDPLLEMCFYSYPKTQIGGTLTLDVQGTFGPEEFTLRNAKVGDYYIKVNYDNAVDKNEAPTFLKVSTFKNYGKPNEMKDVKVIRLNKNKGDDIIAKIKV